MVITSLFLKNYILKNYKIKEWLAWWIDSTCSSLRLTQTWFLAESWRERGSGCSWSGSLERHRFGPVFVVTLTQHLTFIFLILGSFSQCLQAEVITLTSRPLVTYAVDWLLNSYLLSSSSPSVCFLSLLPLLFFCFFPDKKICSLCPGNASILAPTCWSKLIRDSKFSSKLLV